MLRKIIILSVVFSIFNSCSKDEERYRGFISINGKKNDILWDVMGFEREIKYVADLSLKSWPNNRDFSIYFHNNKIPLKTEEFSIQDNTIANLVTMQYNDTNGQYVFDYTYPRKMKATVDGNKVNVQATNVVLFNVFDPRDTMVVDFNINLP